MRTNLEGEHPKIPRVGARCWEKTSYNRRVVRRGQCNEGIRQREAVQVLIVADSE
jgi:hypothetical protein